LLRWSPSNELIRAPGGNQSSSDPLQFHDWSSLVEESVQVLHVLEEKYGEILERDAVLDIDSVVGVYHVPADDEWFVNWSFEGVLVAPEPVNRLSLKGLSTKFKWFSPPPLSTIIVTRTNIQWEPENSAIGRRLLDSSYEH